MAFVEPPDGPFRADMPDISGDGTDVAFRSDANYTGGNADHGDEIFVVNTVGSPVVTQLTSSPDDAGTSLPSVNDTGSRIAFQSNGNLVPATGNADGNTRSRTR